MSKTTCIGKHTSFQPTNKQWLCPKCGTDASAFVISSSEFDECELLHVTDEVECSACGYDAYGDAVARALANKHDLVPCPHCKGAGMVKRDDALPSEPAPSKPRRRAAAKKQ